MFPMSGLGHLKRVRCLKHGKGNLTYVRASRRRNMYLNFLSYSCDFPYGLAVRIPGFHPGGPGSTPGMGTPQILFLLFNFFFLIFFFFYII